MTTSASGRRRHRLLVAALVIGLGLAVAPAAFQMFSRAPGGGKMIDAFGPYMTQSSIAKYQGYLEQMDRADKELETTLPGLLRRAGVDPADLPGRAPSVVEFQRQWPAIQRDMSADMLTKMQRLIPNYQAVAALPPFWMFPWFFVVPGGLIAGTAALALARRNARTPLVVLAALGIGVALAPVAFQMFTRAPLGAKMITAFEPMMTNERVARVQGYFIVIGAAEGQLRNEVQPLLLQGVSEQQLAAALPATLRFQRDWPQISSDMAPMIGVMADNLTRFQGVDALPPFWMFPWFFLTPGLLVAGCALLARRQASDLPQPSTRDTEHPTAATISSSR